MVPSLESRSPGSFDAVGKSPPKVEIELDNTPCSGISSYTTLDPIEGHATFTAEVDTRFDQISISFLGSSRTMIERPGVAGPAVGRSSAFHTFLRLVQPIEESEYPQPRILEAGRTYTFPFNFVVPERLLPNSCTHPRNHPQVLAAHTNLPPSFGDPLISSNGSTLRDDMAPEMTQIHYTVRASLLRAKQCDDSLRTIVDKGKRVRVIPATDEQPPLDIPDDNFEYTIRKEKFVKKGALRGKMGRMVMAAAQPKAFHLAPLTVNGEATPCTEEQETPSSMATVHLRFDPADESQKPPKLGTLWSKLKVNTYFGAEPWADFPSRRDILQWSLDRGFYPQTVCLASRCVASVSWKKHTGGEQSQPSSPDSTPACSRRCSIQSNSSTDTSYTGPSAAYAGQTYYTATLLVPITLPKKKAFVPTFHSCLISRTYALDLCLSYRSPNATLTVPSLSLRLPVQITSSESLAEAVVNRGDNVQQSADEFFTPRSIAPPSVEYRERMDVNSYADDTNPIYRHSLPAALPAARSEAPTLSTSPPEYSYQPFTRRLSTRTIVDAC